jgi:primosomal protein N' (replication factor Y)
VILQTLLPAHHAIQSILSGDPSRFYDEELAARQLLGYPPAVHLISLSVSGKNVSMVEQATQRLVQRLEETAALHNPVSAQSTRAVSSHPSVSVPAQRPIMILGPVPAVGGRPRGHHRRQILVKGIDRNLVRQTVRASVETLEHEYKKGRVKCVVDVDPIEMG